MLVFVQIVAAVPPEKSPEKQNWGKGKPMKQTDEWMLDD